MCFNNPKDFEHLPETERLIVRKEYEKRYIVFKEANHQAYKRFRESMQVLDVGMLDAGTMDIPPKILAVGLLYLMISKYFY